MLTSLNRLVGMPVIWQDRQLGYVERGVTDQSAHGLLGITIRRGIGAARWIPSKGLKLVGESCVLIQCRPEPMPDESMPEMKQAYLTTGERIGVVNDGILGGSSLKLLALEITPGPLYLLMGRSAYAREFRLIPSGERKGQIVITRLQPWAELQGQLGKEE